MAVSILMLPPHKLVCPHEPRGAEAQSTMENMNYGLRGTGLTSIPGGTSGMQHPILVEHSMGCRGEHSVIAQDLEERMGGIKVTCRTSWRK